MASSSAYDHAQKAGNAGDVWKHFILLAVTEAMIEKRYSLPQSSRFVYVDTHAAKGRFSLPEKGDWHHGLGAIRPHLQQHPEWPYFGLLSKFALNVYPGSWHLVGSYLHEQKVPFELHLAENSQAVKEELDAVARSLPFASQVNSYCQNGFGLLSRLPKMDLLLVDPPYGTGSTDWNEVVRMLPELQRAASFLVWYPITNLRSKPDYLIHGLSMPSFEIHWLPINPGGNVKGCGMVAGGEAGIILDRIYKQLKIFSCLVPWQGTKSKHAKVRHVQP